MNVSVWIRCISSFDLALCKHQWLQYVLLVRYTPLTLLTPSPYTTDGYDLSLPSHETPLRRWDGQFPVSFAAGHARLRRCLWSSSDTKSERGRGERRAVAVTPLWASIGCGPQRRDKYMGIWTPTSSEGSQAWACCVIHLHTCHSLLPHDIVSLREAH